MGRVVSVPPTVVEVPRVYVARVLPFAPEMSATVPVGVPTPDMVGVTVALTVAAVPAAMVVGVIVRVVVVGSQATAGVVKVPFEEYHPLTPLEGDWR